MMYPNSLSYNSSDQRLPQGYVPIESDILCGRGKANAKHPGNLMFNALIRSCLKQYNHAPSRIEKSAVVTSLVSTIAGAGLRFLKLDTVHDQYIELSSDRAHDKVGHAIRDLIKLGKQPGKNKAAKQVAKTARQKLTGDVVKSNKFVPPSKVLSADTRTSSLSSNLDTTERILPSVSLDKRDTLPITKDLFSMSDFTIKDNDASLERMIRSLGSAIEDTGEDLLALIEDDLVSIGNDDIWKPQFDAPLPLDSNIHFEYQDSEILEYIIGLDQI